MKTIVVIAILAATNHHRIIADGTSVTRPLSVPLSALNSGDIISNTISDEGGIEEAPIVDDFTTHGLERLSSAATCLVAGVEYTHGQQIYRSDPCEFCLCLDGEMFCWWQDCPPAMEGPCKDRGPFTPCMNVPSSSTVSSKGTATASPSTSTDSLENSTDSSTYSEENSTEETIATTKNPKYCVLMGRKYEIGDKLPHDTGNCVECICGQGAKVTCSPHQCAPAGEDINDYRPPGPRQQIPDVF